MDFIVSHKKYIHFAICLLCLAFAISQRYFGTRAYYHRTEKAVRQYRMLNKITSVILFFLIVFVLITLFVSCSKEDILEQTSTNRTIIVYMAADNDLYADALADMEEMKQGFSKKGANLIVFIDPLDEAPYLLETGAGKETYIKSYPELNSTDPATLKQIIQEIIGLYPASEYGLILWSHGASWLPAGTPLRSFGKDNGKEMNLPDLAEALPVKFNFILMDACLMGSVEVAYELKDKTDYLIASSTETIYTGFPYDKIIPELLNPQINLKSVAQQYFDYYNALQGAYRSATISVIETQHLPELARQLKTLTDGNMAAITTLDRTSIQRLDVYEEQYTFDLADFINKAFPDADKTAFLSQLDKVVLFHANTPMFISEYEINTYCGLSCYIPHSGRNDLNAYYQRLRWCKDSGLDFSFRSAPFTMTFVKGTARDRRPPDF